MKRLLTIEYDFDFEVIGISSYARDYRLCWGINNKLELSLERAKDITADEDKQEPSSFDEELIMNQRGPESAFAFSQFSYVDEEKGISFQLINNRCDTGRLLPEQKQADFLMLVKGLERDRGKANIIRALRTIPMVVTAFSIDVNKLKSKHNLITID